MRKATDLIICTKLLETQEGVSALSFHVETKARPPNPPGFRSQEEGSTGISAGPKAGQPIPEGKQGRQRVLLLGMWRARNCTRDLRVPEKHLPD